MIAEVKQWLLENETLVWWLASGSVATLLFSIIVVPIMVSRMREDYFINPAEVNPNSIKNRHPAFYFMGLVGKNVVGGLLVVLGIILSIPLVPGQGLLTILIGLLVMDFPGKKRAELFLIRRKPVKRAVDWMRRKAGRAELQLPHN